MTREDYNKSVDQYSDNLFRFLLSACKNEDLAKDLVQDSFEKLWMKHEEISFEKVKSWLFSTGYHRFIDETRKSKKRASFSEVDLHDHLHHHGYSDLQEILRKAIDKLPEDQKAVILLRDYEGYNYDEIGELTGLSESQVKVYIYRARVFLKKYIGSPEVVI